MGRPFNTDPATGLRLAGDRARTMVRFHILIPRQAGAIGKLCGWPPSWAVVFGVMCGRGEENNTASEPTLAASASKGLSTVKQAMRGFRATTYRGKPLIECLPRFEGGRQISDLKIMNGARLLFIRMKEIHDTDQVKWLELQKPHFKCSFKPNTSNKFGRADKEGGVTRVDLPAPSLDIHPSEGGGYARRPGGVTRVDPKAKAEEERSSNEVGSIPQAKIYQILQTPTPSKKRCSHCKEHYPATMEYFASNRGLVDGMDHYCKGCRSRSTARTRAKRKRAREDQA